MEIRKRKWSLESLIVKWHNLRPVQIEEDLILHFDKDELFDHHVILPHSEVNPLVYETVDRFTNRYGGDKLNLTIYSGAISKSTEQFFRESFVAHYEDEYRNASLSLYGWYLRVIVLALVGVLTYYVGIQLEANIERLPFLITAIANISLFCIWEICNTNFKRRETVRERKKIKRARDANIRFHNTDNKRAVKS